jgi:hypothetical protein
MTASNHALTGAVIALAIRQPLMVIPLAVVSHFLLDALPHFGGVPITSRKFLFILAGDAGIAAGLLLSMFVLFQPLWWLPLLGAVCAMSPDLMWFPNFIREITGRECKKPDVITKWHKKIQWYERPQGMVVEVGWFILFMSLLFTKFV